MIDVEGAVPEWHLAGAEHRRMRGQDLLGQGSAGARHADDQDRELRARSQDGRIAQVRRVEAAHDLIHPLRQFVAIVGGFIALGEFVGLPIVFERTGVFPHVVEVFAQPVAQADLVRQRWLPRQQAFDALEPGTVGRGHLAMRCDAEIRKRKIRIDGDRPLKQFLRFGKATAVSPQFAQKRQRFDVIGIYGERGLAAGLSVGRTTLLAHRQPHA